MGSDSNNLEIRDGMKRNDLNEIYKTFESIIDTENNEITRENANMNADSPAGMMMKFASEISRKYADDCLILDKEVKNAVSNNYLHIHDKDYYSTRSLNCIHYNLTSLLNSGFSISHSFNRKPKHIESVVTLICILYQTVQNEMFGGQSIPAFDFYLAPYVRTTFIEEIQLVERLTRKNLRHLYDVKVNDYIKKNEESFNSDTDENIIQHVINETVRRVHQAMEAFIHNLNTMHSRGGNQVVFSSVNYGTDTSAEGRCIIRELLNATYEGVGNGSTAIFPIQIWKKKKGVNFKPEDPNYDLFKLACKVTAKRFYPNFINLDADFNKDEKWKENDPKRYYHEVATMGCRTRVYTDRFGESTSIGRGNLSFCTINIVKLALECMNINDENERIDEFFKKLEKYCNVAVKQLLDRYEYQSHALKKQFPTLMSYLWKNGSSLDYEDEIKDVIKHGTITIGYIGLAECLIALVGKHHGESEEAQDLGLRIVKFMSDKCKGYSDKYDKNITFFATPAEGLAGKFTKKDKAEFGIIKGITDKEYYTNSNHVPVYFHCSPRHKAKIEGPYHELTLGGNIFYVEMDGDVTKNVQSVEDVVNLIDEYNIGYGAINHFRNHCKNCGYEDSDKNLKKCPKCKSDEIDTIQRITGYLVGTIDRWNPYKIAELNDRVSHR